MYSACDKKGSNARYRIYDTYLHFVDVKGFEPGKYFMTSIIRHESNASARENFQQFTLLCVSDNGVCVGSQKVPTYNL